MYYQPTEATREIKRRLANFGRVVFISHAEDQMLIRGIDGQEVNTCVRSGVVRRPGELKNGEYRYRIESNLSGGIAAAVEIPDNDLNVYVVTVFKPEKKRIRVR